LVVMVINAL